MPTIRIDNDVYAWLQSQAVPFEDNPNSVLRRLARLGTPKATEQGAVAPNSLRENEDRVKTDRHVARATHKKWTGKTGEQLNKEWGIGASQARFHHEGRFYENLHYFPGALCDLNGYLLFRTQQQYDESPYLRIGMKLNVPGGISSVPGYTHMG